MHSRFMTLRVCCLLLVIAAGGMLTPEKTPAQEILHLSYAYCAGGDSILNQQMDRWKKEIETGTNGRLILESGAAGPLPDAQAMLDGIMDGKIDVGCLELTALPRRFIVSNAVALPLSLPDARAASLVLMDLVETWQPAELGRFKVLALFTSTPTQLFSTRAVRAPADWLGLDLWASGQTAPVALALGANPIGLPASAMPEALERGIVKGTITSVTAVQDSLPSMRYVTLIQATTFVYAMVMNQTRWDQLPYEFKQLIDTQRREHGEWTARLMDQRALEVLQAAVGADKMEIIRPTQEQRAWLHGRLQALMPQWRAAAEAQGLPADRIFSDLQSLCRHYAGGQGK